MIFWGPSHKWLGSLLCISGRENVCVFVWGEGVGWLLTLIVILRVHVFACLCSNVYPRCVNHNWASTRVNLSSGVCEQQRRRPACAYAQSDQRLCRSYIGKYHVKTGYMRNFNFIASLCSWAGWFGFDLEQTPKTGFLASNPIYGSANGTFPGHTLLLLFSK